MGLTEEFFERVHAAAEESPLVVERTESGFDVKADVVNARWYAVLYKAGVTEVFTHHVAVDEERRTYTITDDSYTVTWKAGAETQGGVPVPVLRRTAERRLGTVKEFKSRKTFALNEEGQFDKVLDYTFSTEAGRRMIRDAASDIGLNERASTLTKVGIVFTVLGVLVALVGVAIAILVTR